MIKHNEAKKLFDEGYTAKYISNEVRLKVSAVRKIIKKVKQNKPLIEKRGRKSKLTEEHLQYIDDLLLKNENKLLTVNEIR